MNERKEVKVVWETKLYEDQIADFITYLDAVHMGLYGPQSQCVKKALEDTGRYQGAANTITIEIEHATKTKLDSISTAINTLQKAFNDNDDYAHGWHCNLAMAFYDALPENINHTANDWHKIVNYGASRFMKICFDKTTSNDMLNNCNKDYKYQEDK